MRVHFHISLALRSESLWGFVSEMAFQVRLNNCNLISTFAFPGGDENGREHSGSEALNEINSSPVFNPPYMLRRQFQMDRGAFTGV